MEFVCYFIRRQMITSTYLFVVITSYCLLSSKVTSTNDFENSFNLDNLTPYTRVSAIGESCMPPTKICGVPNSRCFRKSSRLFGFCKCAPNFYYDRKSGKCIQTLAIGEPCSESQECQTFDRHSYCDFAQLVRKRRPICACQSKYVYNHEKLQCVHCRYTLNDCRDPSSPSSANSLAKYKFALLIKIILIVIGFSLLLSLTFCFFIKILNGYSKTRRSANLNRSNQPIITTTTTMGNTILPPSAPPLSPISLPTTTQPSNSPLVASARTTVNGQDQVHFCISSANGVVTNLGINSKNGRLLSANATNDYTIAANNSTVNNNNNRLLFASSSSEDKPPSYEEAVLGSNSSKRNLLIALNPKSPLTGNPV